MLPSPEQGRNPGRILIDVEHPDGSLEHYENPRHSFVDNWYIVMQAILDNDESVTVEDTTGTSQSNSLRGGGGLFGDSTLKTDIGIGSDGSAFTQSDNSLGTVIQRAEVSASANEPGNQLARASASFSISSSDTIRETGLFWENAQETGASLFDMMFERTDLATNVPISNGDTVSVTYELTWDAP